MCFLASRKIGTVERGKPAEAYEVDPYGRHRVIGPGIDETYFTSDDTYDEMGAGEFLGSEGGTINNSIRYTGQRFDAESNLMVEKNRYYDPAAGRFIGRDPLGWSEGPNRYGYVGGMPTMGVDPLGLIETTCCPRARQELFDCIDRAADKRKARRDTLQRNTLAKLATISYNMDGDIERAIELMKLILPRLGVAPAH